MEQIRDWKLNGATVLEVAAEGVAPLYWIRTAGGAWARSDNLDAVLALMWTTMRLKTVFPAQWTTPDSDLLAEFRDNREQLHALATDRWWPHAPPNS